MIEIDEPIGNPVAFVREHQRDIGIPEVGDIVISSPDYDVLVSTNPHGREGVEPRIFERQVSETLGDMYRSGVANYVPDERSGANGFFNLYWFPSPQFLNDLLIKMGRLPGKDAFRFAHANLEVGVIPHRHYTAHIASGEFPRSSVWSEFHHDRNRDHIIGALLMPEVGFHVLQKKAARAFDKTNGSSSFENRSVEAALHADISTLFIGGIAEKYAKGDQLREEFIQDCVQGYKHILPDVLLQRDFDRGRRTQGLLLYIEKYLSGIMPVIEQLRVQG